MTLKEKILVLHSNSDKHALYIMVNAIDYYGKSNNYFPTWIYLRGGHAIEVFETPEEISVMLKRNTDTRSEQERWLNGE